MTNSPYCSLGDDGRVECERPQLLARIKAAEPQPPSAEDSAYQLREALQCWPLTKMLGYVSHYGTPEMKQNAALFAEVRDQALRGPRIR
jgi:hypothetical protein